MKPYMMAILLASALATGGAAAPASAPAPVNIQVMGFYQPNHPSDPATEELIALMRREPGIRVTQWGGLDLPGGGGRAPLMMSIAGGTAPDIMQSWFHLIGNDIRQGFLHPLNEWIGDDTNGNGQIDDAEARWPGWRKVPRLWRQVATVNGKVYGIPQAGRNLMGVIFRTDLVRAAGLDPAKTPETWDELSYWCQKLTDPGKEVPGAVIRSGQRGIALMPYGFTWLPWMQSAGGDPIVQVRKSPTTGQEYVLPPDTLTFKTPEGEDLSRVEPQWRANFSAQPGVDAVGLYHRLRWTKWLIDPETKEPVTLSAEDLARGWAEAGGRRIEFAPGDVITGMARGQTGQRGTGAGELLGRGEVAMMTWFVSDLNGVGSGAGVDPDLLSWFPFPAKSRTEGRQVVQVQQHYAVMAEGVGRRPKAERDRVWQTLTAITDEAVRDRTVRRQALSGLSRFINPADLRRLGFEDYLREIPAVIGRNYERLDDGGIGQYTEPYMGFWVTMDGSINQQILSLVIAETGETFDYRAALRKVENDANSGLMFGRSSSELDRHRPTARVIFTIMIGFMALCLFFVVRTFFQRGSKAQTRSVHRPLVPWLIMLPALVLIGLWSYYPLVRGMVMAFQDYRIAGESRFVGLDNFITMTLDASFWAALARTVKFVVLNLALAFCAPILVALLLSEIPRGRYFYRTLFFLPQVTSGLVIALLWKMMYEPTPQGFLNQVIGLLNRLPFVEIQSQTWLQDPRIAMLCCVIPTVWATMGMASLIYLAALKGVPEEIYEAADVDGAGVFTKLRKITLPTLLPLIVINFVGAFIGTFQNMGNIFLLTFGGPGEETMVLGLRIWIEAYNNLRFSMATSMAWVMGSLLIGFTFFQIQILKRVEFRKAEWS
jgi:multiple sugar transport system permease protein